jgi:hypothetical protein
MTRNPYAPSILGRLSDVLTFTIMAGLTLTSVAAAAAPLIHEPTPIRDTVTVSSAPMAQLPPVVVIVKRAS